MHLSIPYFSIFPHLPDPQALKEACSDSSEHPTLPTLPCPAGAEGGVVEERAGEDGHGGHLPAGPHHPVPSPEGPKLLEGDQRNKRQPK